ncbi:hypothetical protein [Deinococcus daejeonensis]|uniref:Uncharacterized protein n=1 Tax=Deinococcus daejeonensis TaxID=1007098 RepID=A0ABQ2JBQ4_9DEIO|nr:hypothetical protein [Deinococcus daejeonensis]GGN44230.1 hypothetical protein GCM10010842_32520 [Deinococcus daejeonensis]
MQTYGIFAVTPRSIAIKDDKDTGWVADTKLAFMPGARAERKFTLEHMPTLKGAAQDGGKIKLEVTPRLDGEHLPSVYVSVHLRGNITVSNEGEVLCTTRVTLDELETAGLGVDTLLGSTLCLECTVSNQPTLNEAIQQELDTNRQLEQDHAQLMADMGASPLLTGTGEGEALPKFGDQDPVTEVQDAPALDEPVFVDAGPVPPRLVIDPKQPDEDLPFNLPDTDGAAD